jgi:hypothetical protein
LIRHASSTWQEQFELYTWVPLLKQCQAYEHVCFPTI